MYSHMQELLIDDYEDFNKVRNEANGKVVSATSDGPGAPGGSGLGEGLLLQIT